MKRSLIAAALVLIAGQAFAIDSTTVPLANQKYISGATSTNVAVYDVTVLLSGGTCVSGSTDVYIDTPAPVTSAHDAAHQFLAACTGAAGSAFAGQSISIAKESNGGSNNGTRNVALAASDASFKLVFINPAAPACTGSQVVAATTALAAYTLHTGCTGLLAQVPTGGFADVDPALFLTTTPAIKAALQSLPGFQVVFSPVVNLTLYRALQAAEGLTADDSVANVPSLTRAQLHGIFAGTLLTWNQVGTNIDGTAFSTKDIYICRRGNDSGTQASFTSFFLNDRCNASVPKFFDPDVLSCLDNGCAWDSTTYAGSFVFAGKGGSDVQACIAYQEAQGRYAIGVLATDSVVNSTTLPMRFVGIDGAPPTLSAAGNGSYQFLVENVLNVRTGPVDPVMTFLSSHMGNPSIIAALNVSLRNPAGDGGILGVPNGSTITPNAPPVTVAEMRTNPVSSISRHVNGTNNCQPQSAVPGSEVLGGGVFMKSGFLN
jgi:PBP superfamily domain